MLKKQNKTKKSNKKNSKIFCNWHLFIFDSLSLYIQGDSEQVFSNSQGGQERTSNNTSLGTLACKCKTDLTSRA